MTAPNPALAQYLHSIPLFSLVEPPEMMEILRLLRPVALEAGQVLFREGSPGDAMWILGDGVEVSLSAAVAGAPRPVLLARAGAKETVGEMALIDDGLRSATAVVTQAGSAQQIEAIDFHVLRDGFHPAAFKVLRRVAVDLCRRLRETHARLAPPAAEARRPAISVALGARPDPDELAPLALLAGLPQVVKLALAQKLRWVELAGPQLLFDEGAEADAAYFVLEGEMRVGRQGRTLARIGPGQMLGLVSMVDGGPRTARCESTGRVRLLRLAHADFDALFASANRFAFQIVDRVCRQLVAHLRETNQLLPAPGAGPAMPEGPAAKAPPEAAADLDLDLDFELAG